MVVSTEKVVVPQLRFKEFSGNWQRKKLSDFCRFFSGGTPSSSNREYYRGDIPFIGSGDIYDSQVYKFISQEAFDNSSAKLVKKGDLLYALYGANSGDSAISNLEGAINQAILCIRTDECIELLNYILVANNEKIVSKYLQGGQGNLSANIIKRLTYNIPFIKEQKKIASFLSSVDEKLQQLTKKKELLEEYKKGVMQKIFSQELRFKDEFGNDYPDWEEKKLGEVANFRRGSFPQPYGLRKWYDDENGFPFVQVFDVADNMLLKSTTKRKISEEAKALSIFVKKGTIILTIQGSIGRIAITQYDTCVDRTLLIFQSFNYPIDIVYFTYIVYLLFDVEKRKAPGGTIKTITKEVLSGFKVKLPILAEQKKIANFLSAIDKKIELVNTQIEKTKVFKKGLLQQMFV